MTPASLFPLRGLFQPCGAVAWQRQQPVSPSGGSAASIAASDAASTALPSFHPPFIHLPTTANTPLPLCLSIPLSAPCNVVLASSLLTPTLPFPCCRLPRYNNEDGGRGRPTRPLLFTPPVARPAAIRAPFRTSSS